MWLSRILLVIGSECWLSNFKAWDSWISTSDNQAYESREHCAVYKLVVMDFLYTKKNKKAFLCP